MKYFLTFNLLCCLLTLGACHEKVAQGDAFAAKQTSKTAANYSGKPMAPVHINYQLNKDIQAGSAIVISLSMTPLIAVQQLSLHYATEGTLTAGDTPSDFTFGPAAAGATLQQDIRVIPAADGRNRVIVSVQITSQTGNVSSRSLSIPIVVGNPAPTTLKPQGTLNTDSQGRPIIVMPAQEEVIRH